MTHNYSVVLILPDHLRETGNRLACALGHDVLPGNTYTVPLIAGNDISHYGCHTWATQSFVDMLDAAGAGALPSLPLVDFDLTPQDVEDVLDNLIKSVRPASEAMGHWANVLEGHGLMVSGSWGEEPIEEPEAGFMGVVAQWGRSAWSSIKSTLSLS